MGLQRKKEKQTQLHVEGYSKSSKEHWLDIWFCIMCLLVMGRLIVALGYGSFETDTLWSSLLIAQVLVSHWASHALSHICQSQTVCINMHADDHCGTMTNSYFAASFEDANQTDAASVSKFGSLYLDSLYRHINHRCSNHPSAQLNPSVDELVCQIIK